MKTSLRLAIAALAFAGASNANAAYTMVDLSSYVNGDWSTSTSGDDYPTGTVTIGGIDFDVAPFGQGAGGVSVPGNTSVTMTVGVSMVDTAYVIMNSGWGQFNANNGSLTFAGGGSSLVIDLIQGINIRDHWLSANQVATDIFATATYPGGNRWDVYAYDISSLGGTLDSVTLTGNNGGNPQGQATLTGLTLFGAQAVPEPASWALMILGFGVAGGAMRRSRARPVGNAGLLA